MDWPPTRVGHHQPLLLRHHEPNILKFKLWGEREREREGERASKCIIIHNNQVNLLSSATDLPLSC